jgi:proteasome lid subunit RPN8/RPN11
MSLDELNLTESKLVLTKLQLDEMASHCLHALPYEGCGLIVGDLESGKVKRIVATTNVAQSAKLYSVDPLAHLKADRAAEAEGYSVMGVFHSHTHTDPYPSPTDVVQAPDPSWHYVLLSLRDEVVSTRSYRIVAGEIVEESIEVT